jgi:hypothetical protein
MSLLRKLPAKFAISQLKNANFFTGDSFPIDESDTVESKRDTLVQNVVGGAVDLAELILIVRTGERVSLLEVYGGIIVQENIFASSINGTLIVNDIAGGLEKFQLAGGETLHIKVLKPKTKDVLIWRQDLIVTKIGAGQVDPSTGMVTYQLSFSSKTFVNSLKKVLFRSYKNSLAESVLSIYREISENDLFIEDPKITLEKPFISAGFMPHKAIEYLSHRACSTDNYYVFFEKFVPNFGTYSEGQSFTSIHYFGSIDKLIRESENYRIPTITYAPKENANRESFRIRATNFLRKENFNHLQAMMFGFYNTKITSINPINHDIEEEKLSYTSPTEKTKDFYPNKLIDDANIFAVYNDSLNEIPGRRLIVNSINESTTRNSWLKNNIYGFLAKNYFKISVDIQGGTNKIAIGHVVNFIVPSQVSRIISPTSSTPYVDQIYSGKYLVTSVVHTIKGGQYIKTLELSRASSPYDFNRNIGFIE